jgi:hypothetical protein
VAGVVSKRASRSAGAGASPDSARPSERAIQVRPHVVPRRGCSCRCECHGSVTLG